MQLDKTSQLGEIKIELETIEKIVKEKAENIKGVDYVATNRGQKYKLLSIGSSFMEINDENEAYEIDIYIVIRFGSSMKRVGEQLAEEIKAYFSTYFGMEFERITVHIKGMKSKRSFHKINKQIVKRSKSEE